jgi:hypothetical protein
MHPHINMHTHPTDRRLSWTSQYQRCLVRCVCALVLPMIYVICALKQSTREHLASRAQHYLLYSTRTRYVGVAKIKGGIAISASPDPVGDVADLADNSPVGIALSSAAAPFCWRRASRWWSTMTVETH